MKESLISLLEKVVTNSGINNPKIKIDYPENPEFGDFSTNVAMVYAKSLNITPKVLAQKIANELSSSDLVDNISVAGPGFINIKIKKDSYFKEIVSAFNSGNKYGWSQNPKKEKILIEYTDPNIFKVFHIGHLMSNAIGESFSRLLKVGGSEVVNLCYPSDIGLHIAKSIWAINKNSESIPFEGASIQVKTDFLGKMYVEGTQAYESDPSNKVQIDDINTDLYQKTSPKYNEYYELGKKWSLEHFEILYKRLDTKFDDYIYESEMASVGLTIVKAFLDKGVFTKSEGAIIFKGEDHGLHTRVFVNSKGLPTYETKEIGLNITKFKKFPNIDRSIIVTASEQNDYFKVLKKTLSLIDENVGNKTYHYGHGMLRFASGKMSSRKGNVITAEALLEEIKTMVKDKISDRDFSANEVEEISDIVAIGAIKYTILRQSVGSDVIFDSSASISFEGDSGPYLQYSVVRANSVLEKAKSIGLKFSDISTQSILSVNEIKNLPEEVALFEKLLVRFPNIVDRAIEDMAPQQIANYIVNLSSAFNSFYANNTIADVSEPLAIYRIILTRIFINVMNNSLWILGIKVPKKM